MENLINNAVEAVEAQEEVYNSIHEKDYYEEEYALEDYLILSGAVLPNTVK